jgi:4-hydroxy-tetrahydrodipicolinate reductase
MDVVIFGDGRLGRAIEAAFVAAGGRPAVLGRPGPRGHDPLTLPSADVAIEASRSDGVYGNVAAAVEAGCRRLVIATTGWEADAGDVATLLARYRASAVVAPNLSIGMALFGRVVERAAALFAEFAEVDPYIVEWHRRSKADRPSGTARDLGRRILATHPTKHSLVQPSADRPPREDELEIAVIRAGSSPGMHLVGFDAPGETVELRLTARDRSAYAAGALLATGWLLAEPREPGLHPFDAVVDARISGAPGSPVPMA